MDLTPALSLLACWPTGDGFKFVIPGPLMGAVRSTRASKYADPRARAYGAYCRAVRFVASSVGVPLTIPPGQWAFVKISAFWKGRPRCDGDNVYKGIIDGVWKKDRAVGPFIFLPCWHDQAGECAVVEIWLEPEPQKKKKPRRVAPRL